ncbi:MAG TPA: DeoR family transcriptional regulator, partial [Roseiflexaceae bacterium]
MLTAERRQQILETLRRDGKVLASELSASLAVSEDTIRRDLRELAEAGLLQRVHGGALPRSPASASFAVRQGQAPAAKQAI